MSILFLLLLQTQAPPAAPPPVIVAAPVTPEQYPDYEIGPDDILRLAVSGHPDLDQTVIVQADGTFIYPLLGTVYAQDLTALGLARKLEKLLATGYIREPQATVVIQEYRSKKVLVTGNVSRAGSVPLAGNMHIMEVLAAAGMGGDAATVVLVIRPRSARALRDGEIAEQLLTLAPDGIVRAEGEEGPVAPDAPADIIRVDVRAIQSGQLDLNIPLLPHDTIYVPPAPKFFIIGEANSPGAYTLPPNTTVREAVIMAGGFSPNASTKKIRVIRRVDGREEEVKVSLEDIVQPGDTIVVKASLF